MLQRTELKTQSFADYNNGILCTLIVKNDANPTSSNASCKRMEPN